MFDGSVPGIGQLGSLSDAAVIDAAAGWARAEAAAAAAKLAAMAELFSRRTGETAEERERWWVDPQAAVGAELAAAVNISARLALYLAHRGTVLREQLPRVGELFAAGVISDEVVRVIVYRTGLITDEQVLAAVDAELAARVSRWGPWSVKKIQTAIDAVIEQHDPGGLRQIHQSNADPAVQFGSPTDAPGMTSLWARLYAPDAAVIEAAVDEMAAGVCEGDPRSLDERRVAACCASLRMTMMASMGWTTI
ncbi:DUF222 domain-containing protein [Mycolicibacterium agri]|uniref:DUF222 domain-containing protein n=1 Tax=Mycolicibacterium agri TaxID=36811 RepID=A0A7I9VVA7_MYCAG|nr:DUF222 domain-containing protein [Mycolicibacterium agri]GFG49088.1 hypothetical protein MAGR_05290 [Mycolicibacterium agri]